MNPTQLKILFLAFTLLSNTCNSYAKDSESGNGAGNGGDLIRYSFLVEGEAAIRYLYETPNGREITRKHRLNLNELSEVLTTKKIRVVSETLIDNNGSIVDAIGSPAGILLNQKAWAERIMKSADLRRLVIHEIFRASAVNDDDYRISKSFPQTKINPPLSEFSPYFIALREEFKAAKNLTQVDIDNISARNSTGGITYKCVGAAENSTRPKPLTDTTVTTWRQSTIVMKENGSESDTGQTYQRTEFGWVNSGEILINRKLFRRFVFIRLNNKGELLFEVSYSNNYNSSDHPDYANANLIHRKAQEPLSPPSTIIPNLNAFFYGVCTPLPTN